MIAVFQSTPLSMAMLSASRLCRASAGEDRGCYKVEELMRRSLTPSQLKPLRLRFWSALHWSLDLACRATLVYKLHPSSINLEQWQVDQVSPLAALLLTVILYLWTMHFRSRLLCILFDEAHRPPSLHFAMDTLNSLLVRHW